MIRDIKSQIETNLPEDAAKSLKKMAQTTTDKLSAVEEELYQVKNQSNQDPLNFPIKLNNRLAYLRKSVESGDGPPTAGAYKVFNELSSDLKTHLDNLDSVSRILAFVKSKSGG